MIATATFMTASEKKSATIYWLSAKATINWLFPKAVALATAIALQHDNNWDFGCVAADGGIHSSHCFTAHVHFSTEEAWVKGYSQLAVCCSTMWQQRETNLVKKATINWPSVVVQRQQHWQLVHTAR